MYQPENNFPDLSISKAKNSTLVWNIISNLPQLLSGCVPSRERLWSVRKVPLMCNHPTRKFNGVVLSALSTNRRLYVRDSFVWSRRVMMVFVRAEIQRIKGQPRDPRKPHLRAKRRDQAHFVPFFFRLGSSVSSSTDFLPTIIRFPRIAESCGISLKWSNCSYSGILVTRISREKLKFSSYGEFVEVSKLREV